MEDERRAPENSTKSVKQDPAGMLAVIQVLGTDQAIKQQERDGQQDFVKSTTLPTKMSSADRQTLEAAGVKFLDVVDNDPLFQYVILPEGWQRVGQNEYWSDLVDDQGKVRAAIFYKAAFYDRRANLHIRAEMR